jgi:5,10-methylenetetrahydromethanopterin reductase
MSSLRGKIGLGFQGSKSIEEYVKIAKRMEQYNFGWMHVYDDLVHRPCWPILFSVAPHAKKLALGPAVTHPFYRHPAVTAGNIACLDELTHGRAILGIGKGGYYDCFGIEPKHYISVLREAIKFIARMISVDSTPFEGRYFFATSGGRFRFEPFRKQIPIFLGTWGEKTSQLAGELKEITGIKSDSLWNPKYVGFLKKNVAIGATKSNRNPNEVTIEAGALTYVTRNKEEAKRKLRWCLAADYLPGLGNMLKVAGIKDEEIQRVSYFASRQQFDEGAKYVSDSSLEHFTAFGTTEEILEQTARMFKAGVARVTYNHPHGANILEAIDEIGTKILPHFKDD